jgi:hypothetical protein
MLQADGKLTAVEVSQVKHDGGTAIKLRIVIEVIEPDDHTLNAAVGMTGETVRVAITAD